VGPLAATHRDRLPASIDALRKVHSITSSALASNDCGTVRPSDFGEVFVLCDGKHLLFG
jgi:hypothetical protein